MARIARLIFIIFLVWLPATSWSYSYDAHLPVSNQVNVVLESQNQYYDGTPNFCYRCINPSVENLQKKTQHGSFFASEVGFVATNGGGRGKQLGSIIKTDGSTTANQIKSKAESSGFKPVQSANELVDENGVARATIKGGSQRAPGSARPHVELKTSSGQRVNPAGQPVTRKSPENHTPIKNDL